jgi:hypothetical protein
VCDVRRWKPTPSAVSNLSVAAETDRDFTFFHNHRYLAATVGILEHALKSFIVFQNVDILEGNLAPGEVLTGSRSVGSQILAENENRFCGHRFDS